MIESELKQLLSIRNEFSHNLYDVDYCLKCEGKAAKILEKMKEILLILDQTMIDEDEFELVDWKNILPEWFVSKCRPEMTEEEKEQYLKWWDNLTEEKKQLQAQKKRIWSLNNWLHEMDSVRREWYWYKEKTISDKEMILTVLVYGHPFADGALKWLAEAAGCMSIEWF